MPFESEYSTASSASGAAGAAAGASISAASSESMREAMPGVAQSQSRGGALARGSATRLAGSASPPYRSASQREGAENLPRPEAVLLEHSDERRARHAAFEVALRPFEPLRGQGIGRGRGLVEAGEFGEPARVRRLAGQRLARRPARFRDVFEPEMRASQRLPRPGAIGRHFRCSI